MDAVKLELFKSKIIFHITSFDAFLGFLPQFLYSIHRLLFLSSLLPPQRARVRSRSRDTKGTVALHGVDGKQWTTTGENRDKNGRVET